MIRSIIENGKRNPVATWYVNTLTGSSKVGTKQNKRVKYVAKSNSNIITRERWYLFCTNEILDDLYVHAIIFRIIAICRIQENK